MSQVTYSPEPLSGYPEWLPEERLVEQRWLDAVRKGFESYGYCSIETPAAEDLRALCAKGETDKEIYVLGRLQADDGDKSHARLGLRYDLTVPLARYVAQHYNKLVFPFKRYAIGKVWRGERPAAGRFREFYQCDIDVINNDQVPLPFDAEMPATVCEILSGLGVEGVSVGLSNRKVLQGFYEGLGVADIAGAIRIADKLDKIGPDAVAKQLVDVAGLSPQSADRALALARIRTADASFVEQVHGLGVASPLLDEGLRELAFVLGELQGVGGAVADLSIARGFDYYTGTVYEGRSTKFPQLGAIFSGGRYENLAGSFIKRKLPGVGISIGLTRLFSKLLAEGLITTGAKCPTQVLVVWPREDRRAAAVETARTLRGRGMNVELFHAPKKIQDQFRYAERKGIPFVWVTPFEEGQAHEVKDMTTREQKPAELGAWSPS